MNGEKCKRPRCDERANQDGYCGMTVAAYCRDMHEVERERDIARAEAEMLRNDLFDERVKQSVHMRERDEAWAELEALKATMLRNLIAVLKENQHLRRSIEAYRSDYRDMSDRCRGGECTCRVHEWEREAKGSEKRDER